MGRAQDEILHINKYIQLEERADTFGLSSWLSLAGLVIISGAALAFPDIAKTAIEKLPNLEFTKKLTEDMVEKITGIIWGGDIGVGVAAAFPALAKTFVNSRMKAIQNSVVRSKRPKGKFGYRNWTREEQNEFDDEQINSFRQRVGEVKEERGIDVEKGAKR